MRTHAYLDSGSTAIALGRVLGPIRSTSALR